MWRCTFMALIIFMVSMSSCTRQSLRGRIEHINQNSFASYPLNTPDANLKRLQLGQKIIVYWKLPYFYSRSGDEFLHVDLLYSKRQRERLCVPLYSRKGFWEMVISDFLIEDKGEILAFKLQVMKGETEVMVKKHRLWVEIIDLEPIDLQDLSQD